MTYRNNCTLPTEILEQIAEQGLDVLPELICIVLNTAMQSERQAYLGVVLLWSACSPHHIYTFMD